MELESKSENPNTSLRELVTFPLEGFWLDYSGRTLLCRYGLVEGERRVRSSSKAARHTASKMKSRSLTSTRIRTRLHVLSPAPPLPPLSPRAAHTALTQRNTPLSVAYTHRAKHLSKTDVQSVEIQQPEIMSPKHFSVTQTTTPNHSIQVSHPRVWGKWNSQCFAWFRAVLLSHFE